MTGKREDEASPTAAHVVVADAAQLSALIEAAVTRALDVHRQRGSDDLPEHLTVAEAAKELRCSPRTVQRLVRGGRLVASRIDGGSSRVLIERGSVALLLARRKR